MLKKSVSLLIFIIIMLLFVHRTYSDVLTLKDGLRIALKNNRLIKISEQEELISETDTLIARSEMMPDIDISLTQTYLVDQPGAIFGIQSVPTAENNFYAYSLHIEQTLYDFQRYASKYEASKVIRNERRLDTVRTRNMVSLDFVRGYFDLLETGKMLAVAEKEVERLESHQQRAMILFNEGVITKNDLLQAEVKISDAKQKLSTEQNRMSIMVSRLNNILARPLQTDIEAVNTDGPTCDISDLDIEKAWETALNHRAEIEIVNETLTSLDLEKRAIKAEYYPEFFARGGYDFIENRYQIHEGNWSVILGMKINLFNGGKTEAALIQIEQKQNKLLAYRDKIIDDIKLEVKKYLLAADNAQERISLTENAILQAEENLRINRVKYEEGVGTATDVLDAVTLLTTAETNFYRAVYDLRKAEAGLIYSMGKQLMEVYK